MESYKPFHNNQRVLLYSIRKSTNVQIQINRPGYPIFGESQKLVKVNSEVINKETKKCYIDYGYIHIVAKKIKWKLMDNIIDQGLKDMKEKEPQGKANDY